MSNLSAFDEPEKLIGWADKAIEDATADRWRYFARDNHDVVVETDPKTGNELTKFRMRGRFPPDDFARHCTEALNNLRNSFDQSLFAACKAIGKSVDKAHYPWADNPVKSLEGRLKRSGKPGDTVPVELWDTVRRHEPYCTSPQYSGGNDLVRQMATIANRKHSVGFTMNVNLVCTAFTIGKMRLPMGMPIMYPAAIWEPMHNEIILRHPPGVTTSGNRYIVEAHITFDATGEPGKMPAEAALSFFSAKAHEVFDTLKARAIELSAA